MEVQFPAPQFQKAPDFLMQRGDYRTTLKRGHFGKKYCATIFSSILPSKIEKTQTSFKYENIKLGLREPVILFLPGSVRCLSPCHELITRSRLRIFSLAHFLSTQILSFIHKSAAFAKTHQLVIIRLGKELKGKHSLFSFFFLNLFYFFFLLKKQQILVVLQNFPKWVISKSHFHNIEYITSQRKSSRLSKLVTECKGLVCRR